MVVVGDKEYHESSNELCRWSDYFHAAILRSGMKESRTKRFIFPDRDPAGWELVKKMSAPFPEVKIDEKNINIVLPWFDELVAPSALSECDKVLHSYANKILPLCQLKIEPVETEEEQLDELTSGMNEVMNILSTSIQYRFEKSKTKCIEILSSMLHYAPYLLKSKLRTRILSFITDDHDPVCRAKIIDAIKERAPSSISSAEGVEQVLPGDLLELAEMIEIFETFGEWFL